jgi:hypothetical protein
VVTPVSNDKILSTTEGKTAPSGKREAESLGKSDPTSPPSGQNGTAKTAETVDVERANQLYKAASPLSEEDAISSGEQAREVAANIAQQISNDADKGLRAQANSASGELAALLETAPA